MKNLAKAISIILGFLVMIGALASLIAWIVVPTPAAPGAPPTDDTPIIRGVVVSAARYSVSYCAPDGLYRSMSFWSESPDLSEVLNHGDSFELRYTKPSFGGETMRFLGLKVLHRAGPMPSSVMPANCEPLNLTIENNIYKSDLQPGGRALEPGDRWVARGAQYEWVCPASPLMTGACRWVDKSKEAK